MQQTLANTEINSWPIFWDTARSRGGNLLSQLGRFPDSVLVAGCQRSGTTMLTRIVSQSDGMVNFWTGHDDELDAALILSGYVDYSATGRHCFQTTYLNNHYREYFDHTDFRLVWVLRNPYSVVHSMLFNWSDRALDELFRSCGAARNGSVDRWIDRLLGVRGVHRVVQKALDIRQVRRLYRACSAYNGKVSQVFSLGQHLGPERMMVVDYDHLVKDRHVLLPAVYNFIGLPFRPEYCAKISPSSLGKKDLLSASETRVVRRMCDSIYARAYGLTAARTETDWRLATAGMSVPAAASGRDE